MAISQSHLVKVLSKRGISLDVATYIADDGTPRYSSDPKDHSHYKAAYHTRLAKEAGGLLVVNRWNLLGGRLSEQRGPSYFRPDGEVTPDSRKPRKRTRYLYPSRKDTGGVKVYDIHPLARQLLNASPVVPPIYLCIEGCLKADAVLSVGRVAVSVPSVTMWRPESEEELGLFQPYLVLFREAPVAFVIPDCDYLMKPKHLSAMKEAINGAVRNQTVNCLEWLQDRGVRARLLVPPYVRPEDAARWGVPRDARYKWGIDDHLAHGGNLRAWNLRNPLGCHMWVPRPPWTAADLPPLTRRRTDRSIDRDLAVANQLTKIQGLDGVFMTGELARKLGSSMDTVERALESLVERGIFRYVKGAARRTPEGEYVNDPHTFTFRFDQPENRSSARHKSRTFAA
jgi:hypothetical protein